MHDLKTEIYRFSDRLEAAETQLEGLERIGPIEDLKGNRLWRETEAQKVRLRVVIDKLALRLAVLRRQLNA